MSLGLQLRTVLSALLLLLVTFAGISQASAQDPLGGLALGAGLDKLGNDIKESVERAIGGGEILEIGAGGQISILIDQMKMAYQSSLDLTFSKLDAQQQAAINGLSSVINDFEKKTYHDIQDVEGRALAISHSLPFSKSLPRLFYYAPAIIPRPNNSNPIEISLDGDFTDMVRQGLESYLFINGKSYQNIGKSNLRLTFDIPYDVLIKAPDSVKKTPITIHIPYKESCGLLFSCSKTAEFIVPLATLPPTAGTVIINYKTTHPDTEKKFYQCPQEFRQESSDDDIKCGGEHGDLAVHSCSAEPGYTVDPNTVGYRLTWTQGKEGRNNDWWFEKSCSSQTAACWCTSTEHHGRGTSGKIHFMLNMTEYRPINVDVPGTQTIMLKWSDNQVIQLPSGSTWNGSYTRYDGKQVTFGGPYSDDFVHITQSSTIINIATIP